MVATIGVEIEHKRFVRLLDLDGPSTGALSLSTLGDRQPRAVIRVLVRHNGGNEVVHEISVGGIPPMPAGEPRIDLSTRFDGRRTLTLSVDVEGRPHTSTTVDVRRWTGRRATGWIVAAAVLAIAALGTAAWWLVSRGPSGQPAVAQAALQPLEPEEAAETPESTAEPETPTHTEAGADSAGPGSNTASVETGPAPEVETPSAPQEPDQPGAAGGEQSSSGAPESAQSEPTRRVASTEEAGEVGESAEPAPAAAVEEPTETAQDDEGSQANGPVTSVWPSEQATRLAEGRAARISFPPDSAELTAQAKAELDTILQVLSRNPGKPIAIVGHCALFGTEQGRIELSRARARQVLRYLLDSGWQPAEDPTSRGIGAAEPITRDPDEQARNRRVELRFVKSAQ
jgi:outer membrane protein OmpA-like peptidoglycan-associated protein